MSKLIQCATLLTQIVYYSVMVTNVTATSHFVQKITPPGDTTTSDANFGHAVSISNDYCVIGARYDDSSGYYHGGAAYIYKYNSSNKEWNHTQTLYPSNITTYAYCGRAVSLFENSIIIGCYGIHKAYIYKLNETNSTWYQLSTLTAIGGTGSEIFGYSVDITDGYAIVGDHSNDDQGYSAGTSYIFIQTFDESTGQESWIYNQTLYANDATATDYFGLSVSISYDCAIIGAWGDDDHGSSSGSAYIFELNSNTMIWEQVTKLLASDGTTGDYFGISASIDCIYGLAIVGAYGVGDYYGASYIYQRNNDSDIWNETAKLNPTQNDTLFRLFGSAVNIYGETCIVGARGENSYIGAAYEYKLKRDESTNTTTWQNISYLTAFDGESGDHFGYSVDIFGDFVVIGTRYADAVYIYAGINPSYSPTTSPTVAPTTSPTVAPTDAPSFPTDAPSSPPTEAPSIVPTTAPTMSPTETPSSSPTNSDCDKGVQIIDTYFICKFLKFFDTNRFNDSFLSEEDYCHYSDYFYCSTSNSNTSITHIFLNNSNIDASFNDNATFYLNKAINDGSLQWLDLSSNQITNQITDWSIFSQLEYLSLANNQIEGSVDFEQLIAKNGSSLTHIDLSNNNFEQQTIEWEYFEFIPDLEYIDISNNSFVGNIEISYFEYCKNLKYFNVAYNGFTSFDDFDESISDTYMSELEEFIVNNNKIDEQFDIEYFSNNNKLKTIKCHNNSLINSKLDMNDIPSSLETFKCGNNDFGEFIWNPSPYDDYNLQYIDLTNARMYGSITMKFFDNDDGGYSELTYVDFSNNEDLNISIDFVYLDGQSYLYYLNFLATDSHGFVDFDYISDTIADNVTIMLDRDIYCVDSYCSGNNNGRNYGYRRNAEDMQLCNSIYFGIGRIY